MGIGIKFGYIMPGSTMIDENWLKLAAVRLGQNWYGQVHIGIGWVRKGRVGQVRLSQVRLGQVRLGLVRLGQFQIGSVKVGQIWLGYAILFIAILNRLSFGHVSKSKVRVDLVLTGSFKVHCMNNVVLPYVPYQNSMEFCFDLPQAYSTKFHSTK